MAKSSLDSAAVNTGGHNWIEARSQMKAETRKHVQIHTEDSCQWSSKLSNPCSLGVLLLRESRADYCHGIIAKLRAGSRMTASRQF